MTALPSPGRPSTPPTRRDRSVGWRVRHSAWILAVILGAGSLSFIGFAYCAFRMRTRKAWIIAAATFVLGTAAFAALALAEDEIATFAAGYAALLWFSLFGFALWWNRDYLEWRSSVAAPTEPRKVVPVPMSPAPAPDTASRPVDRAEAPLAARSTPGPLTSTSMEAPPDGRDEASPLGEHVESPSDDEGAQVRIGGWQEAEVLAAAHMRQLGFENVRLSASGADGGIDVSATSAVAQVKHHATPVGAPVVQQLRGAAHGQDWALFYALSGYTAKAVEYAETAQIALFTYTIEGRIHPVSRSALFLADRAGEPFDPAVLSEEAAFAQELQGLFDSATALFMSKCHEALSISQVVPAGAQLRAALRTETERYRALLEGLPARMPASQYIEVVAEITGATKRVLADIGRFTDR